MIVIQGKSQKSKQVENLIRKEFRTDKVLIIDAIGLKAWSEVDWATIWMMDVNADYKALIKSFENTYQKGIFNDFDWIVFHANSGEESIAEFKELDRKYPQNFIITIQSHIGITNKYYI